MKKIFMFLAVRRIRLLPKTQLLLRQLLLQKPGLWLTSLQQHHRMFRSTSSSRPSSSTEVQASCP